MHSLRTKLGDLPLPVAPEAATLGCLCPGATHAMLAGVRVRGEHWYWFDSECPLHGNALYATFGAGPKYDGPRKKLPPSRMKAIEARRRKRTAA